MSVALRLLPAATVVLTSATVATVYTLATVVEKVEGILPTISETGDLPPQSCIFSFGSSLASFMLGGIALVRAHQMRARVSVLLAHERTQTFFKSGSHPSLHSSGKYGSSTSSPQLPSAHSTDDLVGEGDSAHPLRSGVAHSAMRGPMIIGDTVLETTPAQRLATRALFWNTLSQWTGLVASLAMMLVGCFQSKLVPQVHYPAAVAFFIIGNVFMFCTTISASQQRNLAIMVRASEAATEPLWSIRFRVACASLGSLSFCAAVAFGMVYVAAAKKGTVDHHDWHWWWRAAAICEYLMVTFLCLFFLPFHREFRNLQIHVLVQDELVFTVAEPVHRADRRHVERLTIRQISASPLNAPHSDRTPLLSS